MNATVLFEGCGGSTAGLHAAGYTTVGFEYWQAAVTCAQANGFDARLHDLSDPTLDHLVPYAPLWWASPPCQPFSAAGAGEGEFDDRDGFPWLLRLTALRLPDVLIVENVKGLTFRKHSAYLCAVLEGFRALGYEVDWKVLMAADYGVPQTRERCIIICRRDGDPITWPAPTHCETGGMFTDKWVTMADALGWGMDRPSYTVLSGGTETGGAERFTPAARKAMRASIGDDGEGSAIEIVGLSDVAVELVPQQVRDLGGEFVGVHGGVADGDSDGVHSHHLHQPANPVKPQSLLLSPGVTSAQPNRRLYDPTAEPSPTVAFGHDVSSWCWTRPATTIAGDDRVFQPGGHHLPGEQSQNAIRLTIPGLATLQGFPPDWKWTGTKTQQARMVGNACPAPLVEALVRVNRPKEDQCPRAIAS